jgi:hypothetical protein
MSYLIEGALGVAFGAVLVLFGLFVGIFLILGLLALVFGTIALAIGLSAEAPGQHPSRCGWLGHDWRSNMAPTLPGTWCRNCLRIKGQPAVAYMPMVPGSYPVAAAAPAYAPGYAPTAAPPAAFVPGYGPPPPAAAPWAPPPSSPAAQAPAIQQLICPSCRSPVQPGMASCPWCAVPFA